MAIVNGAPMVEDLGIEDLSTQQIPTQSEAAPQHLPIFLIWAEKGSTDELLLAGAERENIYGDKTFTAGSAYYNHATIFANRANQEANACIYKRLIPADAGPKANLTLWLDVLKTKVDQYRRNPDGSIWTDTLGDPQIIGTADGYKVKWVVTSKNTGDADAVGGYTMIAGDQVDPTSGVISERYPIFDFVVDSQGQYGNRMGVRFWTPNSNMEDVPYNMMNTYKAFPYYFAIVDRETPTSGATVVKTIFGEQQVGVTFKPGVKDPVSNQDLYIADRVKSAYSNLTDPRYPIKYPPFGKFYIYQNYLDTLLAAFHEAEIPFIDQWSDFGDSPEDAGLFNVITGQSTFGVPYHSFIFSNDSDALTFSRYTDVTAAGGSDGTMNDEVFAEMVSAYIKRYRDRKDPVMDLAYHIQSIFYDSGFPMATKMDLPSFISQRHDTFVVLGTHVYGARPLTESEEHSSAVSLRARVLSYPESLFFGTPAARALIMGCSGVIRNTQFRVPATYEILIKMARYMGASDGRWKGSDRPDGNPGNLIEELTDINMVFVPETVRNRFWDVGLNWIQRFDRKSYFIPAYRTVYPDDTSVLTSMINVMGVCQLNKIGHRTWRLFTGRSDLTNLQLVQRVNNSVANQCKGIFDDRFVIVPRAMVTELDEMRNFSWTLPIGFGAPGMKTVQTLYVQSDRIERLQNAE